MTQLEAFEDIVFGEGRLGGAVYKNETDRKAESLPGHIKHMSKEQTTEAATDSEMSGNSKAMTSPESKQVNGYKLGIARKLEKAALADLISYLPPSCVPQSEEQIAHTMDIARDSLVRAAFYAAGRAAAGMFTGQRAGHVEYASIVPSGGLVCRLKNRIDLDEISLEQTEEPRRTSAGWRILLCVLAGRAAQNRVADIDGCEDVLDPDSAEWNTENSDLFRAARVSSSMVRKRVSQQNILRKAEAWTEEMLDIPEVWDVTERLASRLLQKGQAGDEEIFDLCHGVLDLSWSLPNWKPRLFAEYLGRSHDEAQTALAEMSAA